MIITTTDILQGYRILEYRGFVRGIVVRAPTIPQGLMARFKRIVGGKIGAYIRMCDATREEAFNQMLTNARSMGANAIIGVEFDAAEVASRHSATEVLCYGTAVVVEKDERVHRAVNH